MNIEAMQKASIDAFKQKCEEISKKYAAHPMTPQTFGARRFAITYAPAKLGKEDIDQVNFNYAAIAEALERYNPDKLKNGFNTMPDGEEVYFISTPSAGLWATEEKLFSRTEKA